MAQSPELSSQPQAAVTADSDFRVSGGPEDFGQLESSDAFQTWILGLIDWDVDQVCHRPGPNANSVDYQRPSPGCNILNGNFTKTCQYTVDAEGVLLGRCEKLNGDYKYCSMGLKSIIMSWDGDFHWLGEGTPSNSCRNSDTRDWSLLQPKNGLILDETIANNIEHLKAVMAECDGGQSRFWHPSIVNVNGNLKLGMTACEHGRSKLKTWHCTLDERLVEDSRPIKPLVAYNSNEGQFNVCILDLGERIANDDGNLKLVTPLGCLTILPFTDFHASAVALAMVLDIKARPTVQLEDLESKIDELLEGQFLEHALELPLAETLNTKVAALISVLWIRFCRTYSVDDLVKYSRVCKAVRGRLRDNLEPVHELKVLLDQYQGLRRCLRTQADGYVRRVQSTRDVDYFDETIHFLQMVNGILAEDDPWKPFYSIDLGKMYMFRHEAFDDFECCQKALLLAEKVRDTYAKDDNLKATALTIIAMCNWQDDLRSSKSTHEQTIVDALRKAEKYARGVTKTMAQLNLAIFLNREFSCLQSFDSSNLTYALQLQLIEPLEGQTPMPLPDLITFLRHKAVFHCRAFQINPGDTSLIDKAESYAKEAFIIPQLRLDANFYAEVLATYGYVLALRFKLFESSDDLSRIIQVYKEALILCTPESRRWERYHHLLAQHQLLECERRAFVEDGEGLQSSAEGALLPAYENAKIACDGPLKFANESGLCANTLVLILIQRSEITKVSDYLDEAAGIVTDALCALPDNDSGRIVLESSKVELLLRQFLLRPQPQASSYSEAMDATRRHIERSDLLESIDGPRQVIRILALAKRAFEQAEENLKEPPEQDISVLKQQCVQMLGLDRIQARHRVMAGMILVSLCVKSGEWTEANNACEKTIGILRRLVVTRTLSRKDQEWLLSFLSIDLPTMAGFAALAAATAKGSSQVDIVLLSLQRLESSRGLLAKSMFLSSKALKLIRSGNHSAAEEYDQLLDKLYWLDEANINDMGRILNYDVDVGKESVAQLRVVKGAENTFNFQLGMTIENVGQQRAEILKRLSALEITEGTDEEDINVEFLKSLVGKEALVHIVASRKQTIALLVSHTGLRVIELELKASDMAMNLDCLYGKDRLSMKPPLEEYEAGKMLEYILKWLWDGAVKPIIMELGYYSKQNVSDSKRLPRLWWCASGIVSKLPFHAAGEGRESKENVYNYAICSYTTSLSALKMAQEGTPPLMDDKILAIAMPTTPGSEWKDLEIKEELESIKDSMRQNFQPLLNPGKDSVKAELKQQSIIHFACHGTSTADNPSSSALILGPRDATEPERLTVKELGAVNLGKSSLAFLSACSTAENSSYELADESIHLASAFQLAGFSHVIAAMWEAKDEGATPLAASFYRNLAKALEGATEKDHDVVAYALHDALNEVRKVEDTDNPLYWAPFIHIGA